MHKKIGKDGACSSGDILLDRHTCHNTLQPLAPTGEVTSHVHEVLQKVTST